MTVKFPCRGCGTSLMASDELAGQELACALCGEVTLVPGSGRRPDGAGAPQGHVPQGYRRERFDVDPRRYRTDAHPVWVGLVFLVTALNLVVLGGRDSLTGLELVGWGLGELVIAGLAWATWMRGGNWWLNALLSWLLTPLVGSIHAWASTSATERMADPDRRSYPILIICTLLGILVAVFMVMVILAVVAALLLIIASMGGAAGHP